MAFNFGFKKDSEKKKDSRVFILSKYIDGIPGLNEGELVNVTVDPETNQLVIPYNGTEITLPVNRVLNAKTLTEKEIEEYQKNRIGSGLLAGAIAGPLAGILVGTNKKTKKKKTEHLFLYINYEDKDGNPQIMVFERPLGTNPYYFNRFLEALNPLIPVKEQGPIEL